MCLPATYRPLCRFPPPHPHHILYPQRRRRTVMPPIPMTRTRMMMMSSTPKITRTTTSTTFHLWTLPRPSSVPTRATPIATSCKSRPRARNPVSVEAVVVAVTFPPQDRSAPSAPWKVSRPTSRPSAWRSPRLLKCSSTRPPVRPSSPTFRKCRRPRSIRGNPYRALASNVASPLPSCPSWDFWRTASAPPVRPRHRPWRSTRRTIP